MYTDCHVKMVLVSFRDAIFKLWYIWHVIVTCIICNDSQHILKWSLLQILNISPNEVSYRWQETLSSTLHPDRTLHAVIASYKIHSSLITLYYLYYWTSEGDFAIKFNLQSLFSTNLPAEEKLDQLSYTLRVIICMVMFIYSIVRTQTHQFYHIERLKYFNCQSFTS